MLETETFSFALPMIVSPLELPLNAADKAHILIIGSDEDTLFLLKTLLEIWNYEVSEAKDFESSLKDSSAPLPHVVLMDVGRTFENTLETLRKARRTEDFENVPFVLVSGYSQPKFYQATLKSGADEILVKPVDFDLLRNSIRAFVRND